MKQKRQRKPTKKLGKEFVNYLDLGKKKIAKQTKKKKQQNNIQIDDDAEECIDDKSVEKDKDQVAQKSLIDNIACSNKQSESREDQIEQQKHQSHVPEDVKAKLNNLLKLNQNFKQVKAIHQQNLNKYKYHQSQCKQLQLKVLQNNSNIEKKAKQLRQMSKNVYIQSVRSNQEQFLNPETFSKSQKFNSFIKRLVVIADTFANCPYEDPLQNLKLTKIVPETLLSHKHTTIRQHKKEVVIKDYLHEFPYLTISQQYIPLIQAFIGSTKYIQSQSSIPVQQFPCLFIRQSNFSYSIIQKSLNILQKLAQQAPSRLITEIYEIIKNDYSIISDTSIKFVEQLVYKAINKIRFISLPQNQFELRGFYFGGYIYINTYYIERQPSINRQVKMVYCVFVGLREIANYVVNSLLFALNKNQEDISKTILSYKQRSDPGSKLQILLTQRQKGFVCISYQDYEELNARRPSYNNLGKKLQFNNAYIFEQQRKRKSQATISLISKYGSDKPRNLFNSPVHQKSKIEESGHDLEIQHSDGSQQKKESKDDDMPDYNGYGGVLKDLSFMGNRLPR